jgi:hypothetical protein
VRKKKFPKKKHQPGLKKGKKKGQLEFITLVSPGTGRDEKGAPMSAPSIHIGALVGAGSLWPVSSITRGVSHCGLAIYIKKYLRAKEEL